MDILEQGFAACAAGLREFGYSGVSAEQIKAAHERWRKGEDQPGIIGKFAERDFDERPEIFGEPERAVK